MAISSFSLTITKGRGSDPAMSMRYWIRRVLVPVQRPTASTRLPETPYRASRRSLMPPSTSTCTRRKWQMRPSPRKRPRLSLSSAFVLMTAKQQWRSSPLFVSSGKIRRSYVLSKPSRAFGQAHRRRCPVRYPHRDRPHEQTPGTVRVGTTLDLLKPGSCLHRRKARCNEDLT